jgi:site-specific DNA-methyltransferase (adenine-specific)
MKELLGSLELNRVYQFDCVEGMKLLPDGTDNIGIDLTVTSPPYDDLRNYNGYSFNFEEIAKELYRITKQGGIVVWIVGDKTSKGSESLTSFKQALFFKEIGFNVHDTMIYAKANPFGSSGKGSLRYRQGFEYMFVLSKGKVTKFNPLKEPCKHVGQIKTGTSRKNRQSDGLEFDAKRPIEVTVNQEKVLKNIWEYQTGYMHTTKDKIAYEHPAIFPDKLAEDHILSWSNEGDIIFDPFIGSGTTAKMATLNNRKWLGFEISSEYIEIANKRLDNLEQK